MTDTRHKAVIEKRSYMSPKIELQKSPIADNGLFAVELIEKGELLIDYTSSAGRYIAAKEADALFKSGNDYMLQVDDDLFIAATTDDEIEDADHINHSCDPNIGVKGRLQFVAMRDIAVGEEITFDYGMTDTSEYDIECNCGKPSCRGKVTGDDWKISDLQEKYKGYFSDYIQRKIDAE